MRLDSSDSHENRQYIETVPKKGYRFKATVIAASPPGNAQPTSESAAEFRRTAVIGGTREAEVTILPFHKGLGRSQVAYEQRADPFVSSGHALPAADVVPPRGIALRRPWRRFAAATALLIAAGLFTVPWRQASPDPAPPLAVPLTSLHGVVRAPSLSPDGTYGAAPVQVTNNDGTIAIESYSGDLYYVDNTNRPGTVWRLPQSGGPSVKVVEGVVLGNFDVVEDGLYYIDRVSGDAGSFSERPDGETRLRYYDFAPSQSTTVVTNLGTIGLGLSATRDGRTVFTRVDSSTDEFLVDDFQ